MYAYMHVSLHQYRALIVVLVISDIVIKSLKPYPFFHCWPVSPGAISRMAGYGYTDIIILENFKVNYITLEVMQEISNLKGQAFCWPT